MRSLLSGLSACFQAHNLVMKNKMGWVYIIPVLFSILMVSVIFKFTDDLVNSIALPFIDLLGLETPALSPDPFWEKMKYWLQMAAEYSIYGVLYLISYFIFFKIQKYIVLIAMAPLMAYVSEKAEEYLLGNTFEFKWIVFITDIWRGVKIALKNLILELVLIVLIGIIISSLAAIFTPLAVIAAPVSAILIFVVSAYYYGYSSFDYLNERHRLTISEGNRLIWENKKTIIGNGSFFGLIILVPFLGIILAPIWCPIGAVISAKKMNLYPQKAELIQ